MATKLVYDAKTKKTQEVEFDFTPTNPRIYEIQERLQKIKIELQSTDYKAIKYAEGEYTQDEYQDTLDLRKSLRDEYNALEKELNTLD